MKNNTPATKMKLTKERLRKISSAQLENVVGGGFSRISRIVTRAVSGEEEE